MYYQSWTRMLLPGSYIVVECSHMVLCTVPVTDRSIFIVCWFPFWNCVSAGNCIVYHCVSVLPRLHLDSFPPLPYCSACVCMCIWTNIVYIIINSYSGRIWAFPVRLSSIHVCKNIEKNVNIYMTLIMLMKCICMKNY